MTGASELGNAINEQRLSLHYSIGQLATVVGVTAAEVRSWENGEVVPDGPTIGKLAEALGVKPAKLEKLVPQRAADKPGSGVAEATSVIAAAPKGTSPSATSASKKSQVAKPAPPPAAKAKGIAEAAEKPPATQPAAKGSEVAVPERAAAAKAVAEPTAAVAAAAATTGVAGAAVADADRAALVDLPTERIPVIKDAPPPPDRQATQPPAAAVTAPPPQPRPNGATPSAAIVTPWRQTLEAIFDRDKPWLFWIRTFLLLVGLLILLRVLAWAVPEFFTALGDILDTIQSTTPDPELQDPIPIAP